MLEKWQCKADLHEGLKMPEYWIGIIVGWFLGSATVLFWLHRRSKNIEMRSVEIEKEMAIIEKKIQESREHLKQSQLYRKWMEDQKENVK